VDAGHFDNRDYTLLLIREFNALTPEVSMNWDVVQPQPGQFNFSRGDAILDFARAHGMQVRGHTLVWDFSLPAWVKEGQFSRLEWMNILCTHIKTVVSHYRGRVYSWIVVNEAVANEGPLYETFWLRTLGPEYIAMAFQWAHEADPQALLFYNDHSGEGMDRKSQAIYALVQGLVQSGTPVHGVGLQMHITLNGYPTLTDISTNMQRLADLGLLTEITEMDVRIQYSRDTTPVRLERQAQTYQRIMQACLNASNCWSFTTWGLTDHYSWIPGYTGHPDAPLLFDEQFQPKPAYDALKTILIVP
jgi:endo-1,4-beta-xylanase